MIRDPIDISTRVSMELTSLIETIISQMETDEPVTLGAAEQVHCNQQSRSQSVGGRGG